MSHANRSSALCSYLFLVLLLGLSSTASSSGNTPSDAAAETTSPPLSLADQSDELTIDAEPLQSSSVMSEKDEFLDDANSLRLVPIDVLGAQAAPRQSLRYLSAPLSDGKTSILIPLPSDLDEKTGLVFVEDIRSDGDLSSRTFRTHIFRPSRSSPISFDVTPTRTTAPAPNRVRGARHSTGTSVNTLNNVNKLLGRIEFDSTKAPRTTSTTTTLAPTTAAITSTTEPSTSEETTLMTLVTKPTTMARRTTRLPRRTPNKRVNSVSLESLRTSITSASASSSSSSSSSSGSDSADDSAETTTSSNDFHDVTLTTVESLRRQRPSTTTAVPRNSVSSVTGNTITTTTARARPASTTTRSTTTAARSTQRSRDRPRARSLPPTAIPVPAALIASRADASRMRDREPESATTTTTSPVAISSATTEESLTDANDTLTTTPETDSDDGSSSDESSSSDSEPLRVRGGAKAFRDFPTFAEIPNTKFDCKNVQYPGFYADMETGCQVYHSCSRGRRHSFLCPNGTIFSQEFFVCDWAYNVDCEDSPKFYELNKDAFSSPRSKNGRAERKENAIAA